MTKRKAAFLSKYLMH